MLDDIRNTRLRYCCDFVVCGRKQHKGTKPLVSQKAVSTPVGKLWRLYSQRTHSKATNYYEIDLEEILAATGPQADPADAFRYFWLLFRRQAFEPVELAREGKPVLLSFLDQLVVESEDYAKELGERLKARVFEEVFPHLAAGFIAHIRQRDGLDANVSQEALDKVFLGTLTLLYRLLFLLYAESRDLLPVKEVRGYWEVSLTKLKNDISEGAGTIEDDVPDRLKKNYRKDHTELYDRLAALFKKVDRGDSSLNVPVYNGGLFLSGPDDEDDTPEAEAARFLNSTKAPDRFLARAIDLLARDEDPKRHDLVPIDYKSLGVRHLGSIYEGLLEFKVRIATEKLAVVKQKGREVYEFYSDLDDRERERAERQGRVIKKGTVYIENDKRERKATGSYYTPDYIVKYIVLHAVGPVLQEKFEAIRPRLREAQKWNKDMTRLARSKGEAESKYDHGPAVEQKWASLVDELFDVKVLDPAMGSGHFLVEAVDFITDKALDFLNSFPWNPVRAHLIEMRETILRQMDEQGINIDEKRLTDVNLLKRHVLKRCTYGVDLNPMAVELAKVSLWLNCFTLGAPLSFLDHHLRCGNSLIGVTVEEVNQSIQTGQLSLLSGNKFEGMKQAVAGMIRVGELSDVTAAEIHESRFQYRTASSAMRPAKRLLDVYTSQWFGNTSEFSRRGGKKIERNPALEFLRDRSSEQWAQTADREELAEQWREIASKTLEASNGKRFFHWELEFPEVFYGRRPGSETLIERRDDGGFDAVVGNPPYVRVQELRQSVPEVAEFLSLRYHSAVKNFDIYLPFFELGLSITRNQVSYIAPNKWLATDYGEGLRKLVTDRRSLARFVDFRDFQLFDGATNYTCILTLSSEPKESFAYADASSGEIPEHSTISSDRLPGGGATWNFAVGAEASLLDRLLSMDCPRLADVRDRAFQGLRTSDNDVYVLKQMGSEEGGSLTVDSRATGETHEIETALLNPLLSGEEIRAFSLTHSGQWILFPYEFSGPRPKLFTEKVLRKSYPNAWSYLKRCEPRLRARERGKMDGPDWWAYGRNQNLDQFEQPKVMLPGFNDKPSAGLDLEGWFYHVSGYSVTLRSDAPIDLSVLACLLNSGLLFWFLIKTGVALQRGFVEFRPQYLDRLPLVIPTREQARILAEIARKAREEGHEIVRRELNDVVNGLYGLTPAESALIEGRE